MALVILVSVYIYICPPLRIPRNHFLLLGISILCFSSYVPTCFLLTKSLEVLLDLWLFLSQIETFWLWLWLWLFGQFSTSCHALHPLSAQSRWKSEPTWQLKFLLPTSSSELDPILLQLDRDNPYVDKSSLFFLFSPSPKLWNCKKAVSIDFQRKT